MSVDKVILRAILSTLTAIVLLFAFMLGMLIALYPATMMELTYDLGMDESSIHFAERAYDWSDDEYFIAYGMEVAIGIKDSEMIDVCGEKLIADPEFDKYCAEQNARLPEEVTMTYDQYVYGQVCVAKYNNGQKTEAVERAFALTEGFPKNNAVVAVLYTAMGDRDSETVNVIKEKMQRMETQTFTENEQAYFNEVLALING